MFHIDHFLLQKWNLLVDGHGTGRTDHGTAYHYGSKNLVDYQIPELPYGVLSTTQTGVMEKLRLPGLQQTVGGSASGIYGVDSGVGIPAVTPVIPSYQEPAYTSAKDMERKDGSIGTLKIPSLDINKMCIRDSRFPSVSLLRKMSCPH